MTGAFRVTASPFPGIMDALTETLRHLDMMLSLRPIRYEQIVVELPDEKWVELEQRMLKHMLDSGVLFHSKFKSDGTPRPDGEFAYKGILFRRRK